MSVLSSNYFQQTLTFFLVGVGVVLLAVAGVYAWTTRDTILPNTYIGDLAVGGLTPEEAGQQLEEKVYKLQRQGVELKIDGSSDVIRLDAIGFDLNISEAVDVAYARGHQGGSIRRFWERISSLWLDQSLPAPVHFNMDFLESELSQVAAALDVDRRDVRLDVQGTVVRLRTDVQAGRVIDRENALIAIVDRLERLSAEPVEIEIIDDPPRVDPEDADQALRDAQRIIARPLSLVFDDLRLTITRERLGSWIISEYEGNRLMAGVDRAAISQYVTTIAKTIDVPPEPPQVTTVDGRVTGFVPSSPGRAIQQDELIGEIFAALQARADKRTSSDVIDIPIKEARIALDGLDLAAGITELVGQATTPFTGSPANRVANIKNGVRFLSGVVVLPGEEFSTIGTLGVIDNTTGYLPELVIKGDETIPEYGGGLCQVSTTLFRAVLNAGLPVTARSNHSYRVSYYEKDANGYYIGPGLDATIYDPNPDFRFKNDMEHPILIIGYVVGDKVTFELYGTQDGRSSLIVGPKLLTETAPGDPIYIETTDLNPGETKLVQQPHPGGSAIATYIVTYADGTKKTEEFRSWYRRWPAKYLVGVETLSSPTPTPTP